MGKTPFLASSPVLSYFPIFRIMSSPVTRAQQELMKTGWRKGADCWIHVSGRGTLSDCLPYTRDPIIWVLVGVTAATLLMLFLYLFGSGK